MKYISGPLATAATGSLGGTTASRNKGGAYFRARVVGLNPKSTRQSEVRAQFAIGSKLWSGTLTQSQRDAWTFFAQANPVMNNLGASIILSGLAWMNKLNQVLQNLGAVPITDPPADLSVPALATVTGVTADSGGPSIVINTGAQAVVADAAYYIFATGNLAAGRTPQSSQFRYVKTVTPVAAAVTVDFTDAWAAIFGALASGATVGVRSATVNVATGALTPFLTWKATVA